MPDKPLAEVISVYPDKIRIQVNDIKKFQNSEEYLTVGSYLKVYDHQDCAIIAIIESFSIEIVENKAGEKERLYMVDASPLGLITAEGMFTRGGNQIAIPPKSVEPASVKDIQSIYNDVPKDDRFYFSKLSQDPSILVPVDGNKFFNKHIAVVGSTGSGKSHTLSRILQQAISSKDEGYSGLNNSHIVIFDIHAEYKSAFPAANVISIDNLVLPYWLLNSEELEDLFIESSEEQSHNQVSVLKQAIVRSKTKHFDGPAEQKQKLHYDSPVFFDIKEVLEDIELINNEMVPGANGRDKQGPLFGKLGNFVSRLENKINDQRLTFLLGDKAKAIAPQDVLKQFLSYQEDKKANVTILDISGVPFEVLSITVALISRILFDYAYHTKKTHPKSLNETPLLVVYEEAHKYVPKSGAAKFKASKFSIERIAKEGRKYGITLAIVSQRPSEISETIFSQCSNFVSMRLTNPEDQNYVKRLLPDTLGPLTESLPILQAGQALLIGDSCVMPSLVQIDLSDPSPSSTDIKYYDEWKKMFADVDFDALKDSWQK